MGALIIVTGYWLQVTGSNFDVNLFATIVQPNKVKPIPSLRHTIQGWLYYLQQFFPKDDCGDSLQFLMKDEVGKQFLWY